MWVRALQGGLERLEWVRGSIAFMLVYGSTRTSTVPGISIAGPTPEATLYTPALDAEYLVTGRTLTLDIVPVSPEGVPTPALISRAVLGLLGIPILIVDAGSHAPALAPGAVLPGRRVGGRIDVESALPRGRAKRLFEEARILGIAVGRGLSGVVIGETIPGGTTTAAAILEGLGIRAVDRISSSAPNKPYSVKARVVRAALDRLRGSGSGGGVFDIVDQVGDPVHVSIAGLASGVVEAGGRVLLAGGTQMASVLAIMRSAGTLDPERVSVGTTRWVASDRSSDIESLVSDAGSGVTVAHAEVDFHDSPFKGLRMYDEGYAKEGVGAGGLLVVAALRGLELDVVKEAVYREYGRLVGSSGG